MTWVRVDDLFGDDPRVATVGAAGAGLVILLMVYSNKVLADGFVSDAIVRQKSIGLVDAEDVLALTVRVGLLRKTERDGLSGYQIAEDLMARQPTRADVLAKRDEAKARKDRWRDQHPRIRLATGGTPTERKRNARGTE